MTKSNTQCTATAAVHLMRKHVFWSELYYSMDTRETRDIPTAAVDGRHLFVNPDHFNALPMWEKLSTLVHEILHKMLHHTTRIRGMKKPWGNIAADIVVNQTLLDAGFKINTDWVQPDPKYKGWTFERVYRDILPEKDGGKGNGEQYEMFADMPQDVLEFVGSDEQAIAFEDKVDQQVRTAVTNAKMAGSAPAGIDMALDSAFNVPKESWYNHLRRFFHGMKRKEYDWASINRRNAVLYRMVSPKMESPSLGTVVVFVDESGSCFDVAQQADFEMHLNAILEECRPERVVVAYFQTEVDSFEEVPAGELAFKIHPHGGGGTSFVHLFDWATEHGITPSVAIVLTDMYGPFPNDAPSFPVIWADTDNYCIDPPFGERIYIGED